MPLIDLTLPHGQTLDEARRRREMTVTEVTGRFGSMVQRVEWAAGRGRVKLSGVGFWIEMSVDIQALHATGDIPILGRLLNGPVRLPSAPPGYGVDGELLLEQGLHRGCWNPIPRDPRQTY